MTDRSGFTVGEALVALLLGCLLAAVAVGTFARQRFVQVALAHRAERLAVERLTRHLLGRELRAGDGTEEVGEDTLALRAYRGTGVVCAAGADPREVVVRVEGVRVPDPTKDSVRVVGARGADGVFALVTRGPDPDACPLVADGRVERWRLSDAPPSAPLLARYFERGSYHLYDGALRWRAGRAGRQPLTPQVLRTPPTRFRRTPGGATAVELFFERDSGSAPSRVLTLGGNDGTPDA